LELDTTGARFKVDKITAINEMNKIEFGSYFEGISALGVGQDRPSSLNCGLMKWNNIQRITN
jgi:hypothetical protein